MKELWIEAFEKRIMELAKEYDINCEEARNILEFILESDPYYLNGVY